MGLIPVGEVAIVDDRGCEGTLGEEVDAGTYRIRISSQFLTRREETCTSGDKARGRIYCIIRKIMVPEAAHEWPGLEVAHPRSNVELRSETAAKPLRGSRCHGQRE